VEIAYNGIHCVDESVNASNTFYWIHKFAIMFFDRRDYTSLIKYFHGIPKQEKQIVVTLTPHHKDVNKIEEKNTENFELVNKIDNVWKQSRGAVRYINEERKDEKDWSPIVREIHGILPKVNLINIK